MRSIIFAAAFLSFTDANAIPQPAAPAAPAVPVAPIMPAAPPLLCGDTDIVRLENVLRRSPQAGIFCSSFLQIGTPLPVKVTVTKDTVVTSTLTTHTFTYQAAAATVTRHSTVTQTSVLTSSVPGPGTTITVTLTSYSATPIKNFKRAVAINTPAPLQGISNALTSRFCSCHLGLPRPTITISKTRHVFATTTATVTRRARARATTTQTDTITKLTTTTVTIPAATMTSTSTTTVAVSYTIAAGPTPDCTYSRHYVMPQVTDVVACEMTCTTDPRCRFFAYREFPMGGFIANECDLDDQPYDPAIIQCGSGDSKLWVGYDKI